MSKVKPVRLDQEREPGDISLKVIVGVIVGEACVALAAVITGDISWEAAGAVVLAGVGGYLKTDRIRPTS